MKARNSGKTGKQPLNLTIDRDCVRMARELKKQLARPSVSNVVEFLIMQAAKEMATSPK